MKNIASQFIWFWKNSFIFRTSRFRTYDVMNNANTCTCELMSVASILFYIKQSKIMIRLEISNSCTGVVLVGKNLTRLETSRSTVDRPLGHNLGKNWCFQLRSILAVILLHRLTSTLRSPKFHMKMCDKKNFDPSDLQFRLILIFRETIMVPG